MAQLCTPFRIIAPLMIGVVLTIGTTVGCAILQSLHWFDDDGRIPITYFGRCPGGTESLWWMTPIEAPGADCYLIARWPREDALSDSERTNYAERDPIPHRLNHLYGLIEPHIEASEQTFLAIDLRGFPFRSAYSVFNEIDDTVASGVFVRQSQLHPFERPTIIPLIPYWPGLLANIAIYAALAWLMMMTFTAWRARRRKRNRCPSCGYSLQGLDAAARCPECGAVCL